MDNEEAVVCRPGACLAGSRDAGVGGARGATGSRATSATGPTAWAGNGRAGNSNVGHLYLYEKDPNWEIVEGGAWGKMIYSLSGPEFAFVFNGHQLEANTGYSLIYYADPWPGNAGALIASGSTCEYGNINLVNCFDLGMDLPHPDDENDGAKIWLVLSDDYDGSMMTAWNPEEYLFENNLITYDDTDA